MNIVAYSCWSCLLYSPQRVNTKVDSYPDRSLVQVWRLNIQIGWTDRQAGGPFPLTTHPTRTLSLYQWKQHRARGSACLPTLPSASWMCNAPAWILIALLSSRQDKSTPHPTQQRMMPCAHFLCRSGLSILKCDEWLWGGGDWWEGALCSFDDAVNAKHRLQCGAPKVWVWSSLISQRWLCRSVWEVGVGVEGGSEGSGVSVAW